MGLYDRDYTQDGYQSQSRYSPQLRMSFPQLTSVVKWLLIINIAVFLLGIIIKPLGDFLDKWFCLDPASLSRALQLWRLITFQFLHDRSDIWHIFLNMLGLFFLGPTLERYWSGKKFLIFYLSCGAAGALFYLFLVAISFLPARPLVGASGGILGMLSACAILFPQFIVFIIIFPIPIRVAAVALTAVYLVTVLTKASNAGGDAAHLAGLVAGALYVFSGSWRSKLELKMRTGRWERKMAAQRKLQVELDRILQKVHDSGLHSLTHKEKRTLKKATKAERIKQKL